MPMGGLYKINRTDLKAEMEMAGIENQAELLGKIKLIEDGAIWQMTNSN